MALHVFTLSCSTKPTDLRSLAPAETLVYLETNDLAAALQPIVDSKPFTEVAKTKPDFSALKGVQLAVAVTGFETSEIALTDEHSVGKVQPRFVAIADTHAFHYQAVKFAELKLGSFVADIYDSEPKLEKSDKHGGKYFIWTAADGRKAFALVIDSLIFFGNDESAIEKSLDVRRGESDSIFTTGKLPPRVPDSLANGYVSTDGVAQIANIAGLQLASETSDDADVQSAIAGILPQIIRGTVTDVSWSASKTSEGIEDKWLVTMSSGIASAFNETFAIPDPHPALAPLDTSLLAQFPAETISATRYNLKSPLLAWRSIVISAGKQLDPVRSKIVSEFAGLLFEPYSIKDPEAFLKASGQTRNRLSPTIITAKLNMESDEPLLIMAGGDTLEFAKSLNSELLRPKEMSEDGPNIWKSTDGETEARFTHLNNAIGQKRDLDRLGGPFTGDDVEAIRAEPLRSIARSTAPVATAGRDTVQALAIISILAREGHGDTQAVSTYLTETRFTKTGMERRTVSDFGFIGWMIAQLAAE